MISCVWTHRHRDNWKYWKNSINSLNNHPELLMKSTRKWIHCIIFHVNFIVTRLTLTGLVKENRAVIRILSCYVLFTLVNYRIIYFYCLKTKFLKSTVKIILSNAERIGLVQPISCFKYRLKSPIIITLTIHSLSTIKFGIAS